MQCANNVTLSGFFSMRRLTTQSNTKQFMGRTALHIAVQNGKVDCVKALVSAGSSLEAKDQRGRTPLDIANESRNKKMVAALQPGSGVCAIV